MLNAALVTDAVLPARSVVVPVTVWSAPFVETIRSGGQVLTPDSASPHVKCAVTGPVFQPAAFGGGVSATPIVGGTRSMLMPLTVAVPTLPARSTACPVADWPAPFDERVFGCERLPGATPDRPSVAVNVTTTDELFQPSAFGDGAAEACTAGAVLSVFSGTLAVAALPAWSRAVPDTTCPAPSVVTVTGAGHDATPEPGSEHVNVTTTFELFHPPAFGAGETAVCIVGGASSTDPTMSTVTDVQGLLRSSTSS